MLRRMVVLAAVGVLTFVSAASGQEPTIGNLMARGDWNGVIRESTRIIEKKPPALLAMYAHFFRGHARGKKGDLAGAITDFNRAIEINPNFFNAYLYRGFAKQAGGDLVGASADFAMWRAAVASTGNLRAPMQTPGQLTPNSVAPMGLPQHPVIPGHPSMPSFWNTPSPVPSIDTYRQGGGYDLKGNWWPDDKLDEIVEGQLKRWEINID